MKNLKTIVFMILTIVTCILSINLRFNTVNPPNLLNKLEKEKDPFKDMSIEELEDLDQLTGETVKEIEDLKKMEPSTEQLLEDLDIDGEDLDLFDFEDDEDHSDEN